MIKSKPKMPDSKYINQSVERAFSILRLFIEGATELTASEISKHLSLPQSTAFRFLVTLELKKLVERNPENNKYRLGVACLELGSAFLKDSDLRQRAFTTLEALRDETGETVHLGILEEFQGVYIEKFAGLHPIGMMSSRVGGRFPLYCTGLGKTLLAHLPEESIQRYIARTDFTPYTENTIINPKRLQNELNQIRQQGYSTDNEEHEHGVACIAAPIFKHNGLSGAISISGPANRINAIDKTNHLIHQVKNAAQEISALMAGGLSRNST
jgi:DNA-binding IclR family transcriptional regulator